MDNELDDSEFYGVGVSLDEQGNVALVLSQGPHTYVNRISDAQVAALGDLLESVTV